MLDLGSIDSQMVGRLGRNAVDVLHNLNCCRLMLRWSSKSKL